MTAQTEDLVRHALRVAAIWEALADGSEVQDDERVLGVALQDLTEAAQTYREAHP